MSTTPVTGTSQRRVTGRRTRTRNGLSTGQWRIAFAGEVAAIIVVWETLVRWVGVINPAFLPPPSSIAISLWQLISDTEFIGDLVYSLTGLTIGVVIATVSGIVLGLLVGWFRVLRFMASPFLWLLYSTPKVALGPIIILALGLGLSSKVALVFLLAFFPIVLNCVDGVETMNESFVRAGRVFGFSGPALARQVIVPGIFPFLLVGLQRGVALGFIGEILGEFLGGSRGLGNALQQAAYDFRLADALAVVVVMVIVAHGLLGLITFARKKWASWFDPNVTKL